MASDIDLPPFFDPTHAASWSYRPDVSRLVREAPAWRRAHGLASAARDERRVHLLLIDVQKDFCFPEGTLYVAGRSGRGALDDNRRIAELIHRNLGRISDVTATMDAHSPFQIFFPSFWQDAAGEPLAAHREVTLADVEAGRARPNPAMAEWFFDGDRAALDEHVRHYCRSLEAAGRYRLYLWPHHCLAGSVGHALVGVINEARLWHAFVREAPARLIEKGQHPLTENYSALAPEVRVRADGTPLAERNRALTERLLAADAVIVAGQAASHCVMSTVDDLLAEMRARDPRLARRVHVVTDCMSSVAVADGAGGFVSDFTAQAEAAFARWAEAGVRLVRSTEPMEEWLATSA